MGDVTEGMVLIEARERAGCFAPFYVIAFRCGPSNCGVRLGGVSGPGNLGIVGQGHNWSISPQFHPWRALTLRLDLGIRSPGSADNPISPRIQPFLVSLCPAIRLPPA